MSTLPAGPTVLAQKEGPTLIRTLRAMFVDDAQNGDLFTSWAKTVRSRTRCFAHMSDNSCPLDLACKYSHSLVDPQEIVDLIARHGYPGQGFTMSYTDSADPVLGKKWRLVMFVDDSSADADKPWREVSVVHENAQAGLLLLEDTIQSGTALPPGYDNIHADPMGSNASPRADRNAARVELPPAYSQVQTSASHARSAMAPSSQAGPAPIAQSARGRTTPPTYADIMDGDVQPSAEDDDDIDSPSPGTPSVLYNSWRPHAGTGSSTRAPAPAHSYYNRDLYDRCPGEFPWTAWEMLYWLSYACPPRSRYNRLNTTYNLSLPSAIPIPNPHGMDRLDALETPDIVAGIGKVVGVAIQLMLQHFLAWRSRRPSDGNDFNARVAKALHDLDPWLPHHHLSANLSHWEPSGSLLISVGVPVLLWFIDKWLLRSTLFALIRMISWLFFMYVYPPIIPCMLAASTMHSRLLTSLVLCGLDPAAIPYVVLDYITSGWVYSGTVHTSCIVIGLYMYFAVLRSLGRPIYMAGLMHMLSRSS